MRKSLKGVVEDIYKFTGYVDFQTDKLIPNIYVVSSESPAGLTGMSRKLKIKKSNNPKLWRHLLNHRFENVTLYLTFIGNEVRVNYAPTMAEERLANIRWVALSSGDMKEWYRLRGCERYV